MASICLNLNVSERKLDYSWSGNLKITRPTIIKLSFRNIQIQTNTCHWFMLNHFTCQSGPFKTPYFSSRFKKFHRIERENEKVTWHISRKNAVFTHSDCKEECLLKPTYVQFLFILLRTCIFGTSLESLNVEKRCS